jgi:lipopolysaccharide biosynthesis regulator YciM
LQRNEDFYDAYLTTGVFNYVTGSLGWETRWLALLLGHAGSKERGLEQLREAAAKSELFGDDARVILALVYTRERRFQAAFNELNALHKRHPQNYLVELDMGGVAMLMNRDDQALDIYNGILRKVQAKQDLYERLETAAVYNRLGTAYRSKGDLKAAVEQHQRALQQARVEEHTRVVALLELGKAYDLMGDRERALASYRSVLGLPDFADSLSEARLLIAAPYRSRSGR